MTTIKKQICHQDDCHGNMGLIAVSHSDYADDGTNILLDANENSYGPGLYFDRDSQPSEKSHTPVNGHPDVGPDRYLTNGHSDPPQAEQTADIQLDLHGLNRYPDP